MEKVRDFKACSRTKGVRELQLGNKARTVFVKRIRICSSQRALVFWEKDHFPESAHSFGRVFKFKKIPKIDQLTDDKASVFLLDTLTSCPK